jgi:tetratricopeptide (TPR) repeat protein
MYANAIKLASERLKVNPADATTLGLMAHYQASIGLREAALANIARATALAPENIYVYYNNATAMCALGEIELATAAVEKAIELGYMLDLVRNDPTLCGLGGLPQFKSSVDSN